MISKIFLDEYKKLNSKQKEAVDTIEGPVIIIAGPGTGKTQILAMRIANILKETQINPSNILALTFTNSGVYSMRKRLLDIIGHQSYSIHVHTFHSFCNEVILTFPEKFIFSSKINQLTDFEQIQLIQKIINEKNLKLLKPLKAPFYYQSEILKAIGDLKQEGIGSKKYSMVLKQEEERILNFDDLYIKGEKIKAKYQDLLNQIEKNKELVKIYESYQKTLADEGYYDYNDMILFTKEKLKTDPELLSYYQEKFQYILVDEYQDTNSAQNEIVQILGSFHPDPNIFVVGDDEQSIFRFQGASLENILNFKETYPNAKIIVLEKNYRSGQNILDSSRKLISQNKKQIFSLLKINKNLESQIKQKGEIFLGEFSSGREENFFIAKEIQKLIKAGAKASEIAVIYKNHRDGEELIDVLSRFNLPYQLEVGGSVLDDIEIQKLINILQAIDQPHGKENEQILFEIMHYPFFEIETLDLYRFTAYAHKTKISFFDLLNSKTELKKLNLKNPDKILHFGKLLLGCAQNFHNLTFAEAFELTLDSTGYLKYLLSLPESVHHLNRLQSLFEEIKILNVKNKNLKLSEFLNFLKELEKNNLMIKENPIDSNFEGIRLMTAHKSKGLEFKIVFIIHCTDKHWGNSVKRQLIKLPSGFLKTQNDSDENDEEERRLFYVGLTRAKNKIYLTYALNYSDSESKNLLIPSKFLSEIPPDFIKKIKSNIYKDQYFDRLKTTFNPKIWHPGKAFKEFIKEIIDNFSLSPTSLNAYLECPKSFFYNQILRVPKVKDFSQSYGTAVHKALELFFKKFIRDFELPTKKELINFYQNALNEEILSLEDLNRAKITGKNRLEQYFDFYKSNWTKTGPPVNVEYNFGFHNVHFDSIPITGKIDKIEMLNSIGKKVKITDYKTSSPKSLNQILGQTQNSDENSLNQVYFYKLLAENDPLFSWKIAEIEFDFLSPKNSKFFKVSVPIDNNDYEKFKLLVRNTYKEILNLNFTSATLKNNCQKYNKKCEYFDLCQNNS